MAKTKPSNIFEDDIEKFHKSYSEYIDESDLDDHQSLLHLYGTVTVLLITVNSENINSIADLRSTSSSV